MLCQAEYSDEGYFRIFEVENEWDALSEAESLAEEGDTVFNIFEVTEDYEIVRTIL